MLSAEAVCDLYRARWQIELVFKACKSYLNIDKLGNCGLYQLECLIYGCLTAICIAFLMYSAFYIEIYTLHQRGISMLLFIKLWADEASTISENINLSLTAIQEIYHILTRISKHSLHEKRKRKTTLELLQEYYLPKINYQNVA
ncbi:Transposase DDE domain-containing protein [Anaerovirgula multivorans]|uniref:Transposase DDE domain-containing protein n=2 Tax=Anaerovirgula multivorans TaxID=312168 RepID=A0A239KIA3_9FIRM|nr:Transposase DDE domain-containing protein [Anaerovirgula multivorans]